jgi:hypothetical protein
MRDSSRTSSSTTFSFSAPYTHSSRDALLAFEDLQGAWDTANYKLISFPQLSWKKRSLLRFKDGVLGVLCVPHTDPLLDDNSTISASPPPRQLFYLYRLPSFKSHWLDADGNPNPGIGKSIRPFAEIPVVSPSIDQLAWDEAQDLIVLASQNE